MDGKATIKCCLVIGFHTMNDCFSGGRDDDTQSMPEVHSRKSLLTRLASVSRSHISLVFVLQKA